jgi:hypothetical protein
MICHRDHRAAEQDNERLLHPPQTLRRVTTMSDEKTPLQQSIEEKLKDSLTADGKVDSDLLRKNNPPLAEVLDEFLESKTTRDDPSSIVKDIANVLEARDPKSRLAEALKKLEEQLNAQKE